MLTIFWFSCLLVSCIAVTFLVSICDDILKVQRGIVGFSLSQLEGEMLGILHTRLMSRQWRVGRCHQGPQRV